MCARVCVKCVVDNNRFLSIPKENGTHKDHSTDVVLIYCYCFSGGAKYWDHDNITPFIAYGDMVIVYSRNMCNRCT